MDLEMGDGMSFFTISLGALALCLMGICAFSYCGCSPRAMKARREKEEWRRRIREMELRTIQRNEELQETERWLESKRMVEDRRREYHDHTETAPASASGQADSMDKTERGEYINY